MADWGNANDIDHESIFKASFGDFSDEMVYEDGMNKVQITRVGDDLIMKDEFSKAVNVGAASSSAGYAFTPIVWDQDVIDITRRMTPLLTLIPKVTNKGKAAYYYRITARGEAEWGAEDPAIAESDDTGVESFESIKYLRVAGRVTGVAQIAGAHFESSMQRQVINKTQSINEEIERCMLVGDASTNPYEHDGLQKMLPTDNGSADLNAAITLSDVEDMVDNCLDDKGAPNLLITDFHTVTALKRQMMDYVRYVPKMELAWGLKTIAINTSVGDIPIIGSQFMPTADGSRRVFCVNTNYLSQRILQDITFERLAKTSDSEKFLLKSYRTFISKFSEGMGQIAGIDA